MLKPYFYERHDHPPMLRKIKETLVMLFKAFALSCFLIAVYALGYLTAGYNGIIPIAHHKNELLGNLDAVKHEMDMGASVLLSCDYFKENYREEHLYLKHVLNHGINLGYDENDTMAYAKVPVPFNMIILCPAYWGENAQFRAAIMAHEILHIVGFPNHDDPIDFENDPTYKTVRICFPWVDAP